jgi:hypothetical protein
MSTSELTLNEAMESVTGFDEIAIEKHMHYDIYTSDDEENGVYGREKPVLLVRCMVFVMKRREGLSDGDAYKAVMGMSVREVNDYFAKAPEPEVDPDDPETDEGKDASSDDSEHDTSPSSV